MNVFLYILGLSGMIGLMYTLLSDNLKHRSILLTLLYTGLSLLAMIISIKF